MPAVFVHGVPDTSVVWAPIVERLARDDVVTLRLPGFGEPVPSRFECTKDEYAAWIVERLREIGEPVDLVGHDWGGNFVQYVGSGNPDLIRTWAAGDGVVDREYEWHVVAKMFQTPDVGEQVVAVMGDPNGAEGMRAVGHPAPEVVISNIDDRMGDSILRLYRSAVDVGAEWQPTLEGNTRPALVLWGTDDIYAPADPWAQHLGARVSAEVVLVDGGHWAMFERPDETVAALERFWAATP